MKRERHAEERIISIPVGYGALRNSLPDVLQDDDKGLTLIARDRRDPYSVIGFSRLDPAAIPSNETLSHYSL